MMSLKGRGAPELLSGWLGGRCAGGQILDLNWIISLRISACFGGERERGAAYPMREYSVFLIHVQKADVVRVHTTARAIVSHLSEVLISIFPITPLMLQCKNLDF